MKTYHPDVAPNPAEWLALGERTRIQLAEKYHKAERIRLPNAKAHAVFHAVVENQVALGVESVCRAIDRLVRQGLSRHDAVHAVGSVLAMQLHETWSASASISQESAQAVYDAALERLTAESWRKEFGDS